MQASSQLSGIVEADDPTPLRLEDGKNIAGLVDSINKLIVAAKEAKQSSAEFEFANKVLLRERSRISNALDAVGDGVLAVGLDQRVIFANRAAEPFLNVSPGEVTGKPVFECVKDSGLASFLTQGRENAGGAGERMELSLNDQASSAIFSVTVNTFADSNQEVTGRCVVFHDVTDMKRAEQAQEEFVGSVAHELRTPLTSIKAYVEMLIDGETSDGEGQREFYNIIYEETDRLNRLINNLLNISKMEAGGLVMHRTPTRLKKLIEDSLAVVESQAEKKRIRLNVDLADRLPAVEVDKDMINVVLVNILGNAVKYTPENGRISISSSSTPEEILVHVSDTGVGIAEEDLARIFDKFYRCQGDSDTEGATGSGLGLCIARQIMRLHGGDIRVSSRLGEGAQFTIAFSRSALVTSLGDYEHDD
jgi:two-component system phosphate regulon sensor histidine kinase PhoR